MGILRHGMVDLWSDVVRGEKYGRYNFCYDVAEMALVNALMVMRIMEAVIVQLFSSYS